MLVRGGDGGVALGHQYLSGDNSNAGKPGCGRLPDRVGTDGGKVDAPFLARFWRLHHHAGGAPSRTPRAKLGTAGKHGIGPFGGFDRNDVASGDHCGLTHIETP
jgi:hypothetical protein